MVKPPLAWWRGQRIVTDRDHNLEAIDPGGVEWTSLSPMYNLEIKFPLMVSISFWLLFSCRGFFNANSKSITGFHLGRMFWTDFLSKKNFLQMVKPGRQNQPYSWPICVVPFPYWNPCFHMRNTLAVWIPVMSFPLHQFMQETWKKIFVPNLLQCLEWKATKLRVCKMVNAVHRKNTCTC